MKQIMSLLIVVALFAQLSGCAAMFHGTSDRITIQSQDPDAHLYLDNMLIGKGSAYTFVKRNTTHTLTAKKKGCADYRVDTQQAFDPVSILGVLIDFGVVSMLVVDWGLTGAMWKTEPTNYHLSPICDNERQTAMELDRNLPASRETEPSSATAEMVSLSHPADGLHTTHGTVQLVGLARGYKQIKLVEITVNGKPVRLNGRSTADGKVQSINMKVPLDEGENIIVVTAYEDSGDIGQTIRTVYRDISLDKDAAATPKQSPSGERWAVVIGIDEYSDQSVPPLKYAAADAQAMHAFLTSEGGVKPDHAVLLLNEDATQRKIRQTLGEFLRQKALKQDEVIIYYAGHGTTEADVRTEEDSSAYLVPWDADSDSLFSTAIPMTEIKQIFGRLAAKKILFLQDTCYSGGTGGRTFLTRRGNVRAGPITSKKFLQDLSQKQGRLIVTASDTNEPSIEDPAKGHGIFTYFLLEGLHGAGDLDRDGAIRVRELHSYLDRRVHDQSGGNQTPQIFGDGDMVLVQR